MLTNLSVFYIFIYQPYNLEQWVYLQTMYINSKIFYELIYLVGWRAIIVYMDMPCFLFENTLLLSLLLLLSSLCDAHLLYCTIQLLFFIANFPWTFFSVCIITPAYFFDILCLLIPLYTPSAIILSCIFIPFSRVSVKH